ncbi:AMP-dependent synthetase and ligase [Pandoraea horticolens]|uniref:AMP-dependent synthetase and ligase n=1 Tax=Pandoraea horticolens TaxID=2508298 RepID=A0A5E4X2C1_9BURK|nr:AMP-binding protein [Pandoraea horticolens]VVE30424.1 AMP-dependent synthetase and ligase [Pandoraea horticolens]
MSALATIARQAPGCTPLAEMLCAPRAPSLVVCVDGRSPADAPAVLTTAAWHTRVRSLRAAFAARPAQRLAMCLDDPLDMSCALFAAWAAGRTPVVLPNALAQTRRDFAFAFDEAIDADTLARSLRSEGGEDANGAASHETTVAGDALPPSSQLIIYTSGSSGEPKAITKTLAQLDDEVQALHRHWGTQLQNALVVASVPCHHIYGLWFRVLWPLAAGVPFARHTFAEPSQAQTWRTWPAVVWIAGPAQLTRWPALLGEGTWSDAPRLTFSSGGPLPADAAQQFAHLVRGAGAQISSDSAYAPVEVFGSTETGGIAWRRQDRTSHWTPFDDTTVRVSEDGALEIRSPRVNNGHWWPTDDGAIANADGSFTMTGRLDRTVKIEGKRVSLPAVEAALLRHEWVEDAATVVIAGRLAAAVVLSNAGRRAWREQSLKAVRGAMRDTLAETFDATVLPRRWRFVAALPLNERGKRTAADVMALFAPASPWLPSVMGVRLNDDDSTSPGRTDAVVMSLRVPPDLAHFDGHFPGLPLLPGVVLIDWATRFAAEHASRDPALRAWVSTPTSLQQVKFSAPVLPGTRFELTLTFDVTRLRVHYLYEGARGTAATGYLAYAALPDIAGGVPR